MIKVNLGRAVGRACSKEREKIKFVYRILIGKPERKKHIRRLSIYRVFQKELYKFESV